MDIRLKKMPFEYEGKTYQLTCNFNVLADIQEEYGEFPDFLTGKGMLKKVSFIVASMMNDYADSVGWIERVTPRQVGRVLDISDTDFIMQIMGLITSALYIPSEGKDESPKN